MATASLLLLNCALFVVLSMFLLLGSLKISPFLHPETFRFLKEIFRSSITPTWEKIASEFVGRKVRIHSNTFRATIGWTELIMSVFVFAGGRYRVIGGTYCKAWAKQSMIFGVP